MERQIHVVERLYRDDGSGGETWANKPAWGAPETARNQDGTANVIADHKGPLMCQPCLGRQDPKRHRFGLLVGLPIQEPTPVTAPAPQ